MRTLDDILDRLRDKLPTLRERYAMEQLGVCGSFVRGDQTDESDVDLGMPSALEEGPAADNIRTEAENI
jgi:predicted nucleotidyltransferase